MKHLLLPFALMTFLISSCGNQTQTDKGNGLLSNLIKASDNEKRGVQEVVDFYGGKCEYSVGSSVSSSKDSNKYFKLSLYESDLLEENGHRIEMPASNIAYLFYKNLKEEKKNYDEIRIEVKFKDGQKVELDYSTNILQAVLKRMPFAFKVVDLIKYQKYAELTSLINDTAIFEFNKEELTPSLKEVETQFGKITDEAFRPFGFRIDQYQDRLILHVCGAILREKQNNEFSMDVDLNSDKEEVYLIQFQL
ncbi:MAG TPA: hypothetical protein VL088_08695 [Pedobacter sp.]|nr:hypothetical protein [Pedobacter sp.]